MELLTLSCKCTTQPGDPATTGPCYVETVSSREVKLVLFSSNVTSLGRQRLRCTSQESGLSASMMLAQNI